MPSGSRYGSRWTTLTPDSRDEPTGRTLRPAAAAAPPPPADGGAGTGASGYVKLIKYEGDGIERRVRKKRRKAARKRRLARAELAAEEDGVAGPHDLREPRAELLGGGGVGELDFETHDVVVVPRTGL